jgi:hypothetical protein
MRDQGRGHIVNVFHRRHISPPYMGSVFGDETGPAAASNSRNELAGSGIGVNDLPG